MEEYRDYHPEAVMHLRVRGLASLNHYEVDISLTVNNGGFPRQYHRIWVECKSRTQGRIEKEHVLRLVYKAQDSVRFARKMGITHHDGLMLVSNVPFHANADGIAKAEGVACFVFDRNRVIEQMGSDKPLIYPQWLGRC
jgi:hypothetical protein